MKAWISIDGSNNNLSGDTLQLKDYSKTDWQWTMFNPQAKQERHDRVFPEEMKKAYEIGKAMI